MVFNNFSNIWLFITISTLFMSVSTGHVSESYYRNIVMIKTYWKFYNKAVQNYSLEEYNKMEEWSEYDRYLIRSSPLVHRFHLHALSIAERPADITEILTFLGIKFLSFISGMNYLHCQSILQSNPEDNSNISELHSTVSVALRVFSVVGIREVVHALLKELERLGISAFVHGHIWKIFCDTFTIMQKSLIHDALVDEFKSYGVDEKIASAGATDEGTYKEFSRGMKQFFSSKLQLVASLIECAKFGPRKKHLRIIPIVELTLSYTAAIRFSNVTSYLNPFEETHDLFRIILHSEMTKIKTIFNINAEEERKLLEKADNENFEIQYTNEGIGVDTLFHNKMDDDESSFVPA